VDCPCGCSPALTTDAAQRCQPSLAGYYDYNWRRVTTDAGELFMGLLPGADVTTGR
jgi:hypothetical protein